MEVFGMLTAAGVTNVGIVNTLAAGTVGNVNDVTIKPTAEDTEDRRRNPASSGLTLRVLGVLRGSWVLVSE